MDDLLPCLTKSNLTDYYTNFTGLLGYLRLNIEPMG